MSYRQSPIQTAAMQDFGPKELKRASVQVSSLCRCGTVQYSTYVLFVQVQYLYSTVHVSSLYRYSTVLYSTVQYRCPLCTGTVPVQYSAVQVSYLYYVHPSIKEALLRRYRDSPKKQQESKTMRNPCTHRSVPVT
jgi:hypothetical protein